MKNLLLRAVERIKESAAIASFASTEIEVLRLFSTLLLRDNRRAFPLTSRFSYNSVEFPLTFQSHADLMLFYEIFCGHPYRIHMKDAPEYVVDLGANIGISTLYLHCLYPNAKIAAVEANDALLARLKEITKGIESISILPYAATNHDGAVAFHINEVNALGSSLIPRATGTKKVEVEGRTLASLEKEAGFLRTDLVKFDIEGAEKEVFESYEKRDQIKGFVGEVHEDLMKASTEEFKALWPGMSFTLVPTKKEGRYNIYGIRS